MSNGITSRPASARRSSQPAGPHPCSNGDTPPAVWSHPGLNDMFERHGTTLLPRACAYDPDLEAEVGELRLALPDHHVTARATIDLGDRIVELAHHGRGHTGHDIVAKV